MPVDLKTLVSKVKDSYAADRNKIRDTIVLAEKPDTNIDITSASQGVQEYLVITQRSTGNTA